MPRTYVLVHGAWHDRRSWDRLVPILEGAGHLVFTPELTGHGSTRDRLNPDVALSTHADDVIGLIRRQELSNVILVGHSYAGMVISAVANEIPERIARLVYVDAMVPTDGENAVDVMPVTQYMIDAAAQTAQPWRIPPLPEFPAPVGLFGVIDPEDMAWVRTMLSDESIRCFQQAVRLDHPAFNSIAQAHIHCVGSEPEGFTRRPVPSTQPNGQPSRVDELRAGHDCMITAPKELAEILLQND